jgi:RNA polymerase sigma factor (sigma-70 family)
MRKSIAANDDAADMGEFVSTGSHAAFERLVRRYAGLVYAACRCRLDNATDAEDAAQAVFVALASKARSVNPVNLRSWLHGAAMRAATFVLRSRLRRAHHEEEAARMRHHAETVKDNNACGDIWPLLGPAIEKLPRKPREIVLRHYASGQNRSEIAREMGLAESTVRFHIKTGIEKLRLRLRKHDVSCSTAVLGSAMAAMQQQPVPPSLLAPFPTLLTGNTAALAATGEGTVANAKVIAKGVLKMMFWEKARMIAGMALCGVLTLSGGLIWGYAAEPQPDKPATVKSEEDGKLQVTLRKGQLNYLSCLGQEENIRDGSSIGLTFETSSRRPLVVPWGTTIKIFARSSDGKVTMVDTLPLATGNTSVDTLKTMTGKEINRVFGFTTPEGKNTGMGATNKMPSPQTLRPYSGRAGIYVAQNSKIGRGFDDLKGLRALAVGSYEIWAELESAPARGVLPSGAECWRGKLRTNILSYEVQPTTSEMNGLQLTLFKTRIMRPINKHDQRSPRRMCDVLCMRLKNVGERPLALPGTCPSIHAVNCNSNREIAPITRDSISDWQKPLLVDESSKMLLYTKYAGTLKIKDNVELNKIGYWRSDDDTFYRIKQIKVLQPGKECVFAVCNTLDFSSTGQYRFWAEFNRTSSGLASTELELGKPGETSVITQWTGLLHSVPLEMEVLDRHVEESRYIKALVKKQRSTGRFGF